MGLDSYIESTSIEKYALLQEDDESIDWEEEQYYRKWHELNTWIGWHCNPNSPGEDWNCIRIRITEDHAEELSNLLKDELDSFLKNDDINYLLLDTELYDTSNEDDVNYIKERVNQLTDLLDNFDFDNRVLTYMGWW